MSDLIDLDRASLLDWADTRAAPAELPRLIRRLILETGAGITQVVFPAAEGVSTGGWDGTVHASVSTAFVPGGRSVWELSVESSYAKADDDYVKRLSTPDGSPMEDCTYVQVILRPWTKRADWASSRTAEGRWRQVRALGVDDIDTWLEQAPITRAWLAEKLGRAPMGITSVDYWWHAWSQATSPALSPAFVLAGRQEQQTKLIDHLTGPPQLITVSGPSLDDVKAFIGATMISASSSDDGSHLARAAFINSTEALRELSRQRTPSVLIVADAHLREEAIAVSGHHVIAMLVDARSANMKLPSISPMEATSALVQAGLAEDKAEDLARTARRSLNTARRQLAVRRELMSPAWATSPLDRLVSAVWLAGRWRLDCSGDIGVLERLSGVSAQDLPNRLMGLADNPDPIIVRVGQHWTLTAAQDSWQLLAPHLSLAQMSELGAVILDVLGELDPSVQLAPEERWLAGVIGVCSAYSADLRRGLGETLALMGVYGESIKGEHGASGSDWASTLVVKLLDRANADESGQQWSSLGSVMTMMGEAAPDQFLEAVEVGVEGASPVLGRLFTDHGPAMPFGPRSRHVYLLWALETIAWSASHFGRVADILARLVQIDPGGKSTNRPAESLKLIFLPWRPGTAAGMESRLAVLDQLRRRHPQQAWQLMTSLLPHPVSSVAFGTQEPQFRTWRPTDVDDPSFVQVCEFYQFLAERMVEDAAFDGDRWVSLVESAPALPEASRDTILSTLRGVVESGQMTDENYAIWNALNTLKANHRQHPSAEWALSPQDLEVFDQLQQLVQPPPAVPADLGLFELRPTFGGVSYSPRERDSYFAQLSARRNAAVAAVDERGGLQALHEFALQAVSPRAVGTAVAQQTTSAHDKAIVPLLDAPDSKSVEFAEGFVWARFRDEGWPWVESAISEHALGAARQAMLLLLTADFPLAWERAEALGPQVEDEFWLRFVPSGLGPQFAHVAHVAQRLSQGGRNVAALILIDLYWDQVTTDSVLIELAAELLERLGESLGADPNVSWLREIDFTDLLDRLFAHRGLLGLRRLARLEWTYLAAMGFDAQPKALASQLACDPEFFVEAVSGAYRHDTNDEESEVTESQQRRAELCYRLLDRWSAVPGLQADGSVDSAPLTEWFVQTSELLRAAGRLRSGMAIIGRALGRLDPRPGHDWPELAVRNLIEDQRSIRLDEGFLTGVYNARGVVWRSHDRGGESQRKLEARYRELAQRYSDQWPRTAAIIRKLADSYARDARNQDERAERYRQGFER